MGTDAAAPNTGNYAFAYGGAGTPFYLGQGASVVALASSIGMNNLNVGSANTYTYNSEYANTASGSTVAVNWQNGARQSLTVNANTTLSFSANPVGPTMLTLRVVQGNSYTLTMPSGIKYQGGTPYAITSSSGAQDILSFYWNGSTYYCSYGLAFS